MQTLDTTLSQHLLSPFDSFTHCVTPLASSHRASHPRRLSRRPISSISSISSRSGQSWVLHLRVSVCRFCFSHFEGMLRSQVRAMEEVADGNFDEGLYPIALLGYFAMILIMFVVVNYINAPYGRHVKRGWGFGVAVREAWIIMESPALFVMALVYHTGQFHLLHVPHVLLRLHQLHYIHRSLIFPFRMRADGKAMPVSVVVAGFLFNVYNSYVQARWISHYGSYPTSWLSSPQFLLGVTLFLGGFACNIWADNVLLNLRTDKEDRSYKIPKGFLYVYVTCPNYLSEVVEWLGWAIMTNSLAGFAFFVSTLANLAPRAKGHHEWYYKKFSDYPKNRKALIPFIY